ncbi:MAG: penicillin-binding protein 2 [Anaerolineales bacterium]
MAGSNGQSPIRPWRLWVTYAIMGILMALYAGRLYQLQIIQGDEFQAQAEDNRLDQVNIPAPRGVIYDRNGSQLVRNIPVYNVNITAALLPESQAETQEIYQEISEWTGVPVSQEGPPAAQCVPGRGIEQLVVEGSSLAPFEPWPVACDIGEETARILMQRQVDMPGVTVEAVPVRDYRTGVLTSSVIGYLGPVPAALEEFYVDERGLDPNRDKVGYAGIEVQYQDVLSGQNGLKVIEEDVAGQVLREIGDVRQPEPGNNLRLSLDTRLQSAAYTALQNRMEFLNRSNPFGGPEKRSPIGVVIAMNPQTGEILALVSLPTYENNRMARFIPFDYYQVLEADERGNPLVNHAIQSEFPPGSTFKMVTAIGALNEGVISPNRTLFDPGQITIANTYFPNDPGRAKDFVCWKEDGHGDIDFVHGIGYSCNVYFYKIGGGFEDEVPEGLGITRLGEYARALGYGGPLGIDLPAEEDGLIPNEEYKRINLGESWSTGDTYNSVVGQGFVGASPLQVLTSVSTLANGGKVMWPHVVTDILDGEGNVIEAFEPCVLWDLADDEITPLEDIGAGCPNVPDTVRDSRQAFGSPDKLVSEEAIRLAQEGMRLVVADPDGTAHEAAQLERISTAGKTGTGEFCDEWAQDRQLCEPGDWPTHSWYVGYAPFENPEIVVAGFVYNGGEGALTAGPVVRTVLEAYFQLKAIDVAAALP